MPINYTPLKGNAGTIKFILVRQAINRLPVPPALVNQVWINVIDFSEEMEHSSLNSDFEDINANLRQNYYGDRQVVSFSLVNSPKIPIPDGATKSNLVAIQEIVQMINHIRLEPDYRLKIQYRDNVTLGMIEDAVFTGKVSLLEVRSDSNVAQTIPLEFKSRQVSNPDFGYDGGIIPQIVTEDSTAGNEVVIIRENSQIGEEIPLACEINIYSSSP
jgi:hypothetical protein